MIAALAVSLAGLINLKLFAWIETAMIPWIGRLSWMPQGIFHPEAAWFVLISGVLFLATIIPALPMLLHVVRIEPGQVIRDL